MLVACLVGGVVGLVFRPLFLVPVIIAYCIIQIAPFDWSGQPAHLSILHLCLEVLGLNAGYLGGALLRRILCMATDSTG